MTAHGAGARAWGIDKHRIEQDRFTKHRIERREDRIKLARIARDSANTRNTRLMQACEILIALAVVQIERSVLTIVAGTLGLAHHHIGLGTTTGANLKAAPGTGRRSSDELSVKVRGHGSRALKHTRRNRGLCIDRRMAAREHRRHKLR